MPFDLASAQPVGAKKPAFDLTSAQPVATDPYANDPAYQEMRDADAARARSPTANRSILGNLGHAVKELVVGVPELAAQGVTGLAASASNLVNGATGAKELFKNPGESDAAFYARTRNDLTYQPRGELGKAVNGVLEPTIGRAVNAVSSGVGNLTGNPADTETMKDALNVLPAIFGAPDMSAAGIAERAATTAERKAPAASVGTADTGNPVAVLRAAGYKLRPSDAAKASPEMGVPGTTREKFSGSGDIRKDFIDPNQRKTTQLAATEVGLPANTPRITPTLLDQQRAPHIATYGEVGQAVGKFDAPPEFGAAIDAVSDQTGLSPVARRKIASDIAQYKSSSLNGPDVVKTISALRRRSVAEGKSQDVNTQDLGNAHRQVADILEDQLSQQASAIGQPELAAKLKDARTALAKINDVDSAVKGGQVDAHALNNLVKNGAQLSGNLKIIADAAEYAPHVTRHPQSVADVGAVESPLPLVNPLLDIASGGIRPLVRSYLKSDTFQNKLGPEASKTGVDSPLGEYFHKPEVSAPAPQYDMPPQTSASSMNTANRLAGDLSLAPDTLGNQIVLPPAPPSLHADIPSATPTNGIPFTGSPPTAAGALAGNLSLADEFTGNGGMTFNPPNGLEPGLGARQLLATKDIPDSVRILNRNLPFPEGVQRSVTGYRGVGKGRDPLDTSDTLGNALFYSPDESTATSYKTPGGQVAEHSLDFKNLLDSPTLETLRKDLNLPKDAELVDIINAARKAGYDGLTYDLKPGREYIRIPHLGQNDVTPLGMQKPIAIGRRSGTG